MKTLASLLILMVAIIFLVFLGSLSRAQDYTVTFDEAPAGTVEGLIDE